MSYFKSNWNKFAITTILIQFLLTIFQVKFFPFSDHGVFQHYRKINGQKYYRIKEKLSNKNYIEDEILFTYTQKVKSLIAHQVPKKRWQEHFKFNLALIEEFELSSNLTNNSNLFKKKVIYSKEGMR